MTDREDSADSNVSKTFMTSYVADSPRIFPPSVCTNACEGLDSENVYLNLMRRSLMRPANPLKSFLKDTDGTTAVEYCVMLAAILIALILGLMAAGSGVSDWWGNIESELDSNGI